jgi:hypothetical protein
MLPFDRTAVWKRPTSLALAKRRMVRLAQATLTDAEVLSLLSLIDAQSAKIMTINGYTQAQGVGLVAALGQYVTQWNMNYQKMVNLQPTIDLIKVALEAGDYSWDATKDSAVQQWKVAVDNLVNIMSVLLEPVIPGGGPGPVPPPSTQPPPPVSTPPNYTPYYIVGGVAGALLLGSIIYIVAK